MKSKTTISIIVLLLGLISYSSAQNASIAGWCTHAPNAPPKRASSAIAITATRPDGAVRLTTPPTGASDQNPAFSPDGTELVFTRFDQGYNDGPAGLFLLDLGSSQAITRLTPIEDQDNVNLPGAAWNVNSDRIVFSSDRQDADDLWRIAPDGIDLNRITTHSGLPAYFEPSWSPDGQWIVFEASHPGGGEDGRIGQVWKVRADGTDLIPLTDGTHDDRQPNWSPAGDRVLFQRRTPPDGQWDIYTVAPDGSDPRNATNSSGTDETDASWSPDGGCIVYSSDEGALPVPNIFITPANGGSRVRITTSETCEDGAPSWSPDGTEIAFESHEDPDSPSALWHIAAPANVCGGENHHNYLPLILANCTVVEYRVLFGPVDDQPRSRAGLKRENGKRGA